MSVRQLQVTNDSVQDRLILRISTDSHEEIRVFFTRRFLREMWPHLTAMLAGHLAAETQAGAANAAPSAEPSRFDKPFEGDNPRYPLGSSPLLASEATLEAAGEGIARLTLREGRERSFNLNLNGELMQALCAMLRAASEQSRWDLSLDYNTAVPGTNRPTSLLH